MIRPQLLLLLPLIFLLGFCQEDQALENRWKRGAPDFRKRLWNIDSPIPYIIDSRFSPEQQNTIRNALSIMSNNTCITYKEDNGPGFKLEYIFDSSRCAGDVGVNGGMNTRVWLEPLCVHNAGILHETMHTLGFRHTQTRSDRDKYIRVDDSLNYNPNGSNNTNYMKVPVTEDTIDYGIPYEYNSLLHYPPEANLLEPLDPDYFRTMGGNEMTFNDWKMINMHYKCIERCKTENTCENGGYPHPRRCGECVCPRFHTGAKCEQSKKGKIILPGYPTRTFDFPNNETVKSGEYDRSPYYLIKTDKRYLIRVAIVNITYANSKYMDPPNTCNSFGAEIVDDGDLTRVGKRFCAVANIGYSFVSESNWVGFNAFTSNGWGFTATVSFTVEDKPGVTQKRQIE